MAMAASGFLYSLASCGADDDGRARVRGVVLDALSPLPVELPLCVVALASSGRRQRRASGRTRRRERETGPTD